jgi:hypothetical protein
MKKGINRSKSKGFGGEGGIRTHVESFGPQLDFEFVRVPQKPVLRKIQSRLKFPATCS